MDFIELEWISNLVKLEKTNTKLRCVTWLSKSVFNVHESSFRVDEGRCRMLSMLKVTL